nr:immunoglobulin heavy chain junction region [Macaca mulatta]
CARDSISQIAAAGYW